MAPLANAIGKVMLPIAHQLLVRVVPSTSVSMNSSDYEFAQNHAGKTPEQWDKEGRYNYEPSSAGAVIFLALYAIATLTNLFQYVWYRSWFWWPMVFAVISTETLPTPFVHP